MVTPPTITVGHPSSVLTMILGHCVSCRGVVSRLGFTVFTTRTLWTKSPYYKTPHHFPSPYSKGLVVQICASPVISHCQFSMSALGTRTQGRVDMLPLFFPRLESLNDTPTALCFPKLLVDLVSFTVHLQTVRTQVGCVTYNVIFHVYTY